MSRIVTVPPGLLYLPVAEEVIPLLKRSVIPLTAPEALPVPGYVRQQAVQVAVTEAEYLAHLQGEYQRLPPALKGLLTAEAFIRQAESKRGAIEKALLAKRQQQSTASLGSVTDWVWQSFFTDPFCPLAWSQSGFDRVWLGIEADFCPQATVRDVQYQPRWPADYPARLWADAPAREGLRQRRLVLERAAAGSSVQVAGQAQWLLRLPPKSLRVMLTGSGVSATFAAKLQAFVRQDFRFQRIPLAAMAVDAHGMSWQFTAGR